MNAQLVEREKTFTGALIQMLGLLSETPTREFIFQKAKDLALLMLYEGPLERAVDAALNAVDSRMGEGVSLIKQNSNHDDRWVERRSEIEWMYSNAYEGFLKQEGWSPRLVNSLNDVCGKILVNLQDPQSDGAWKRRGLVIGHVQSGKTANYMGLIAKAADAGYKFIIVIAGIHNNLRRQTQERFDEGFIGMSSDPKNRMPIGVGLNRNYKTPATLTTINDDFNNATAGMSGWKINDFTKPIILIIKKNVSTLDSLYKWLKELNSKGGRIKDVPMLLIDDEADNASINTNKPEIDPTRTNACIRKILGLFDKSSFVGYTATPFANIFINPDAYDENVEEELFPSDFIYCLDAPNTYFGPSKVFSNDPDQESRYLRVISDCADFIPETHKSIFEVMDLPPSLYEAINQFIIVKAIRILRGQQNKHCSMMINVSRFVAIQNQVKSFVSDYLRKASSAVQANYKMNETHSKKNNYMINLKSVFESEFNDAGFEWHQIKDVLNDAVTSIKSFVVNSKTADVLDYRSHEKDGGLTALAIGGLSLSRGLTIEGLCISYMYRNTKMYDTLMQMGRWFGYRYGYEDLCRVHLSQDSINWYRHISEVTEEVRAQVYSMRRANKSPREFGMFVRTHPDTLLITAANKMRSGEKVITNISFSGKLKETYQLIKDVETNIQNEYLVSDYYEYCLNQFNISRDTNQPWFFEDIPTESAIRFISQFSVYDKDTKNEIIEYFSKIASKYNDKCDVIFRSVGIAAEGSISKLGSQARSKAQVKSFDGEDYYYLGNRRVASGGDERIGLSSGQLELAEKRCNEQKNLSQDYFYREVRNKPLLTIHILDLTGDINHSRVPAYGISFPPGDEEQQIEIIVTTDWIKRNLGPLNDNPDDEDDYDV